MTTTVIFAACYTVYHSVALRRMRRAGMVLVMRGEQKRETTTRAAVRDRWNNPRAAGGYVVRRLNDLCRPTAISGNPHSGNGVSHGCLRSQRGPYSGDT